MSPSFAKLHGAPSGGFPADLDIDVETEDGLVELNLHKTSMSDAAPVLLQRGGNVIKVPFQRSEVSSTLTSTALYSMGLELCGMGWYECAKQSRS